MFCPNCGTQVPEDANACPNCGTFLKSAQPAPEAPVYQAPVQQPTYQAAPVYNAAPVSTIPYNTTPILVFGIIALSFACTFYFSFVGIIFGIITKSKVNAYLAQGGVLSGKAKVGSILGKVGLILGIVLTAIAIVVLIITIIAASSYSYYY